MTIKVSFENPPGTQLPSYQFASGQALHIAVKITGPLGIGEPGFDVVVVIADTNFAPIDVEGSTNLLGNVSFDVQLPNVVAKATATFFSTGPLGEDTRVINIGIGTPPAPTKVPGSTNWYLIGGVALGGAVLVGLGVRKLIK